MVHFVFGEEMKKHNFSQYVTGVGTNKELKSM